MERSETASPKHNQKPITRWVIIYTCRNPEFTITQQSVLCNNDFCVSSAHFGVQKKKQWLGPGLHSRFPLDSRWTRTVEDATQMTREAVRFCPTSGLRYAATMSKNKRLCMSKHRAPSLSLSLWFCPSVSSSISAPTLSLLSLSSPSPPSLYVTLLKSDRCGVNLQPSLTPSLLRTSRSHCLRWGL